MARIRLDLLKEPPLFAGKDDYERRLEKLQFKMLSIQQAYIRTGDRAVIVFEGWDAAGKGGTIRRLTQKLDPRHIHVWPIGPPAADEQGRHWLYRFWMRLPAPGTVAVYDRSWYGRVLVERVEEIATTRQWRRAYDEINQFEKMLTDDGVRLVKIFLHVTAAEQLERLVERLEDPYKRWKLAGADLRNYRHRRRYKDAMEEMFERTSTRAAPWTVVHGDKKWVARVVALEAITKALARDVDIRPKGVDPDVRREAEALIRGVKKKGK